MLSQRNSRVFAAGDRQRGITLIGFLFMLVIVGFFAYLAMRLIPAYTEYMGVVKSMELVKNEPNSAQASPEEIRRSLMIKFDTQYVDSQSVPPQAITVLRQGGDATLRVAYEKRIPFAYNVDLVVSFDKSVNLGGGY
ncbi:MAG: DUF4845 domain-containing protein [Rhodanobacter denitrificans]|uniref:DUF4845 domain-containing protein n=1 Tax=Rhodanobacter denitrificans TaxID=666685 RepID=A0A2W5M949_9GAMM|nr:MAG: DUF4845 domain-containing protein [Rhodanobacter denitrificans]